MLAADHMDRVEFLISMAIKFPCARIAPALDK